MGLLEKAGGYHSPQKISSQRNFRITRELMTRKVVKEVAFERSQKMSVKVIQNAENMG